MSKAVAMASKLARMRIIAIPLTSDASIATYYHFQMPQPLNTIAKPSLLKRVTEKTASIWTAFGKAPEGSWKHRTFTYGERLMDKIEFEELSLKSMDPSLGPKLSNFGKGGVEVGERASSIPLVYPAHAVRKGSPLIHLESLLKRRTPSHKQGFILWLIASPFTAPFMLIPIIPNLPFFFCAWRSWHHYRAYKASAYLEGLIIRGVIEPQPSASLDQIYEKYGPDALIENEKESANSVPLLRKEAVPKIVSLFELPSTAEADLYRALDQTNARLRSTSL